jgi:ABC-2 type transport system ATP-binding protein/lipopolysaccharide transport system ATP-binding protein
MLKRNDSMPKAALQLQNVCVSFPLYHGGSRSLKKRLLFRGSGGQIASDAHDRIVVEALKDVNLNFSAGDRVALIGANGAGKTTLLRTMAGIYEPDAGIIESTGRISPMFDIGLGIDSDLSGRDNIQLRALILGISDQEIAAQMDDIVTFTELGDYIDLPVRTYSAGMMTRLTFAVATCFAPEIVLMDEWIVAGDISFVTKAERRLASFVANASILVLASHSAEICKNWCTKAVWMERGHIKSIGPIEEVLDAYQEHASALAAVA